MGRRKNYEEIHNYADCAVDSHDPDPGYFLRNDHRMEKNTQDKDGKKKLPKIGTMDLILVIIGVSVLLFVLKMIQLFETYMAVPDTLITCFFGICGGECGAMAWIKNNKEKTRDRKWQEEDIERQEKATENFMKNQQH